jgi:hypothetical protein
MPHGSAVPQILRVLHVKLIPFVVQSKVPGGGGAVSMGTSY